MRFNRFHHRRWRQPFVIRPWRRRMAPMGCIGFLGLFLFLLMAVFFCRLFIR